TLCPQGCLSLSELIDMGLNNSPETRQTWAKARATAAQFGLGRSDYYPDIDVNYRAKHKREAEYVCPGQLEVLDINQHGPEMTLSWLLFNFGAREAKNRALWNSLIEANWT